MALPGATRAVQVLEACAEGIASIRDMVAGSRLSIPPNSSAAGAVRLGLLSDDPFTAAVYTLTFATSDELQSEKWTSDTIRDIFGNPFRPIAFDPRWLTADVVGVARGIYEDRAFDRMAILTDALINAGCDSDDVLSHCRNGGPHVRGCWVVDRILEKE
jgi:hypothetical protein